MLLCTKNSGPAHGSATTVTMGLCGGDAAHVEHAQHPLAVASHLLEDPQSAFPRFHVAVAYLHAAPLPACTVGVDCTVGRDSPSPCPSHGCHQFAYLEQWLQLITCGANTGAFHTICTPWAGWTRYGGTACGIIRAWRSRTECCHVGGPARGNAASRCNARVVGI